MIRCVRLVCCTSFTLQSSSKLNLHQSKNPWPTTSCTDRSFSNSSRFSQVSNKRTSKLTRHHRVCCWAASQSLYDILGTSPSASEADIKRAYRKLALRYHPDVNKEPNAQQKFMSIKHAYQTLVDPVSRKKYDSANRSMKADQFSGAYTRTESEDQQEFYDLGDFWEDLQSSFEEFLDDMQAGFNNITATDKMKSLWEELADIGEDFVEFLERELKEQNPNTSGFDSQRKPMSNFSDTENGMDTQHHEENELEMKIDEIEEALAQLRKDLGL